MGLLAIVVSLVYFDRDAYTDNWDGSVTLIDAIYYATVTITTTGYGDITPIAPHSRVINSVLITPLRILFLVLLVGTTLEVLANEGRRIIRDTRWRRRMRNHVVVVGFGTKGRSAVDTLQNNGTNPSQVVIIDSAPGSRSVRPTCRGFAAIEGDATRPGGAAAGGDHQGSGGDHHLGSRRLRDLGHPHRTPAQPQRARRGRGTRGRQRFAGPAVRRERGDHLLGGRRSAARPVRPSVPTSAP